MPDWASFGASERTVQRALAATLGIGPKLAAQRVLIQQTAQLLAVESDASLTEIAARLGYADQAHLTSVFRRATGTTPGAYRRALREFVDLSAAERR